MPARWRQRSRPTDQRGSASVTSLAVVAFAAVAGGVVLSAAVDEIDRARAQAVADLVALASAHDDRSGAEVARRNGGVIVSSSRRGPRVEVVVETSGRRVVAAAELDDASTPIDDHGPGPADG